MYKLMLILIISFACIFAAMQLQAGIKDTKHNLSASGPGTIKAQTETQICVFCHTPHAASTAGPLWNHSLSTYNYTLLTPGDPLRSTTQKSDPIQPDGGSKLCLSCHDGTVALGQLYNKPGSGLGGGVPVTMLPGATYMPAGSTNLGTDLRAHHLVSIAYNVELINAKTDQCINGVTDFRWKLPDNSSWTAPGHKVRLKDTNAQYPAGTYGANLPAQRCSRCGIQCTTCHDPHLDTSAGYRMFVVADYDVYDLPWTSTEKLCTFCHSERPAAPPAGCYF